MECFNRAVEGFKSGHSSAVTAHAVDTGAGGEWNWNIEMYPGTAFYKIWKA